MTARLNRKLKTLDRDDVYFNSYWSDVEKNLLCPSGRMQYTQTEHFQF